jgi:hypothetical protein
MKMARNVYETYRRLAQMHGHLWASNPLLIDEAEETRKRISETWSIATEDASILCERLSGLVAESVKNEPAPHNSGILFDPEKLYHTTATGREHWAIVDDDTLVYQIWRPGRIVAEILFHSQGITVNELNFDDMEARHWDVLMDTLTEVLDVFELRDSLSKIYREIRVA